MSFIPYFPLARGLLTGKYRRDEPAPVGSRLAGSLESSPVDWDRVEALEEFAGRHSASLLELAIGGLLARPVVSSVIAGATTPEQAHANAAAGAWEPSPPALRELRSL